MFAGSNLNHLKFKGRRELLGSSKGLANFLLNYSLIDFVYLTRLGRQKHTVPLVARKIITRIEEEMINDNQDQRHLSRSCLLYWYQNVIKKRNMIHSNLSAESRSKQQLLRGQYNDTSVDAEA